MNVIDRKGEQFRFGDLDLGDGFYDREDLYLKCTFDSAFNFQTDTMEVFDESSIVYYVNCDVIVR